MANITAEVRLRPIRYAFLTRPGDGKRLLEIFRVNTCLWGGKYNPIIPYFSQKPNWWGWSPYRRETAARIINGYLDYFEPDFIVEAEEGLAASLGFDSSRIVQLASILPTSNLGAYEGHGFTVLDLYKDMYNKDFQYLTRAPHNIVDATPENRHNALFAASVFGSFPTEEKWRYLGDAFSQAFDPVKVALGGRSYAELIEKGVTSALRMGHSGIEVENRIRTEPLIFIIKSKEPRDLIDYWNRRATGANILPIPLEWLEDLSSFCKKVIADSFRPLPNNSNGVMMHASVAFSASISDAEIDEYKNLVTVDIEGANFVHKTAFWRPPVNHKSNEKRPMLTANEARHEITLDDDARQIRFDSLMPEFASRYGSEKRWANVIKLTGWFAHDQIATAFPCNYRNPKFPKLGIGGDDLLTTTEGLVTFPRHRGSPHFWELQDGVSAISEWLKTQGISATLSDAGKSTQQVIQTLGGFRGVQSIALPAIVKLLDGISKRPVMRCMQDQEFKNRIEKAVSVEGDIWRGGEFKTLVDRKAVELGLELRCSRCSSWGWFSLAQIDHTLNCQTCLQQFRFPSVNPSSAGNTRWSYRLNGPFAQPDYARGGYAAALTIRFFATGIGGFTESDLTWSAGQELALSSSHIVEADLILWHQRKRILELDHQVDLIFGEAKSFGREAFGVRDVENMKLLASRFPGAILVFSTMKKAEELSKTEIGLLTKIAKWGREFISDQNKSRAPVIILTGTELFAPYRFELAWKALGGKHAELIEPGWVRTDNLRVLANLTQQLYLNLPPFYEWHEEKWRARTRKGDRTISSKINGI